MVGIQGLKKNIKYYKKTRDELTEESRAPGLSHSARESYRSERDFYNRLLADARQKLRRLKEKRGKSKR